VDLQCKTDRWLLRKGVEAADDEQEILRNLRQITDTFYEFQTKVLLRVERNTDTLIQVRVLFSAAPSLLIGHIRTSLSRPCDALTRRLTIWMLA
jgi:hypothetical protein